MAVLSVSKMLGTAAVLVLMAGSASAASLFGGSSDSKASPAPYVPQTLQPSEPYREHKALVVVNPGGWGSPYDEKYLTQEDMALLTKVMQDEKKMIERLRAEQNATAKAAAQQNAIDIQDIANLITPLGTQIQAVPNQQQTDRAPTQIPKVPVGEWEKINQGTAQP